MAAVGWYGDSVRSNTPTKESGSDVMGMNTVSAKRTNTTIRCGVRGRSGRRRGKGEEGSTVACNEARQQAY
jgi:hypothetical protein